ncbi:DUF974-domain-containing protein [Exidia glandulosa HHB12029]|uniref:DUF974-domain-containing protein n=1 Tax=Exidia glandulosa HHB12029 TaxID=1314781 RepID=A0A165IYM7_EXIGL|nr:DUF974-domain-containing protein [Exidia glandulosa HHB12029]
MADPLTLKVMRINRPSLAAAWTPFFSSSPAFSAHATHSIMSMQSDLPLPAHPTTLRDLTAISDVLMLPPSFGAIQLGETFSSCLCINNDANADIHAVALNVEMQTATSKVPLASIGGPDLTLTAENNFVETVVHHEIKELGQHVLACTITYRLPNSTSEEPSTIRKYYKFAVTNPLSVKTKVHTPRSPSALLSRAEREKVFLEVHVQNLTADPLWFEQMKFECAENWLVNDANLTPDKTSIFTGAAALIQPQDTRQYVYILTPTAESIPSFPVVHAPGAVIPLGRLDISWRSSFGSPGRLLTSMLSRRIPLAPAAPPASALPPHLQRGRRPGSPTPSVPSTPPGSPFRARTLPQRPGSRPQSPAPSITSPTPTFASLAQAPLIYALTPPAPIDFDLAVLSVPREPVPRDTPFTVRLAITLAALPPAAGRTRFVSTAIQHVQPARPPNTHTAVSAALASNLQVPSRPTSPSPRGSVVLSRAPSIAGTETLVESPLAAAFQLQQQQQHSALGLGTMPPPHALEDAGHAPPADGVLFLGASSQTLPTFVFSQPEAANATERQEHTREFELAFMPTRTGFATVGGLRLVLLSDEERVEAAASPPAPHRHETRMLKEWDVVAEILVV